MSDTLDFTGRTVIVTGVGPEMPDMALSPLGKYHLRLAAGRDPFAVGHRT